MINTSKLFSFLFYMLLGSFTVNVFNGFNLGSMVYFSGVATTAGLLYLLNQFGVFKE